MSRNERIGGDVTTQFPVHPDDVQQLLRIRRYLIGFRITEGLTQQELSVRVNGTAGTVWDLEYNQTWQWRFSRLQLWVAAFGLRLDARLCFDDDYGLESKVEDHPEVAPLISLALTADNWPIWQRSALTSALRVARIEQGISAEELAQRRGVTRKAITNWENIGDQFMLPHLLHHARALDGRIDLRLAD